MTPWNRRKFLVTGTGAALTHWVADATPGAAQAQPAERKLGTCGPPPRKNPERQAAAEAFPPLPLPAVPLRRSEPKAEPAPPLMAAKLEYGTTQDWNTDPGDLDYLMRQVRSALGLWYGWKNLNINELVALYQTDKRLKIPALYISGHEAFQFTPPQRDALRQYLLDGGTLFGDACCGRPEFAQSFQTEVRAMFPDRGLDPLELDHPLFRAFYKYSTVNYIDYRNGAKAEYAGPPQMLGMNLGCRTAIVFTPADISCGWDDHTHPSGFRMFPGDAMRLGINLISYVAAMRNLAETQAFTRQIRANPQSPRSQFVLAQLKHQGDWNPDPNSTYQWLRQLAGETALAVSFDLKYVEPTEAKIAPYPFLYLTGFRDPKFSADELAALRRHLQAGGMLFINNCSGYNAFDRAIREMVRGLFPDQKMATLPADHELFRAFAPLNEARDRQSGQPRPVELEAISIRKRAVLIYSKNDMITHLKQLSDPFGNGYDSETCKQLALNLVAYALQH
ncbi:DUF4159 domain-containing protein [Tuwongella immobilis]|uniref:DUF4159 domain-containing protein n=1 Tax=Tuwongella immobilis TaxID=692036 RepID=A0A6C2YMK4_9BACT